VPFLIRLRFGRSQKGRRVLPGERSPGSRDTWPPSVEVRETVCAAGPAEIGGGRDWRLAKWRRASMSSVWNGPPQDQATCATHMKGIEWRRGPVEGRIESPAKSISVRLRTGSDVSQR
jgi:hypothetical protein